jgi:microcystin-dependent protein
MSSTYSTRIRLEKQGSGENANTWGDILNANVIELADEAIAGYAVVSVSNGEEILTALNGTVDQSRNATLEIAGTLTANVTVVIPAQEKTYFIRENTTGSFNTFLKTAGGSAVEIEQGTNIMVATDGTTIVTSGETSVTEFTTNALTVVGNVSAATLITSGNATLNSATVTGNVSVASVVASGSITAATLVGNGAGITGLNILPTGAVLPYGGMAAPSGFVLADGASLSRTTFAALFAIFGTQYGTASASTFNVPDLRGRVVAGYDSMGGSSADRLTNFSGGVNGDVLGGWGGLESCLLTGAMSGVAAHTHTYNKVVINAVDGSTGDVGFSTDRPIDAPTSENAIADAAQAHNNVQPTIILTFIIKT